MRSALQLTVHATTRMAQRGIANDDLELITGDVVHEHGRVWVYNQVARDGGTEVAGGYTLSATRTFRPSTGSQSCCEIMPEGSSASGWSLKVIEL
jgi:hypothetical protein